MIFKSFQIKNYKSFIDSGKCSVQNGVTIFAGQNESGKTNILKALAKINDKTPTFTEEEYSFGRSETPEIVYDFELSETDIEEVKLLFPKVELENVLQVIVQNNTRNIDFTYSIELEEGVPTPNVEAQLTQHFEKKLPKFITYQTLVDELPDKFTAQDVTKTPIKRLSKYLDTDFTTIFSARTQQQQKNQTRSLSRVISDDFAEKYKQKSVQLEFDINNSTMSIYIQDKKSGTDDYGYSFYISQRSMGLRWYLNFYIALKGEELKPGDIILVDEPGMYLHPKAQQEMRQILNAESENNQIIYTTHSPYLIDADNVSQIRLVEKIGGNGEDGYNEFSQIKERIHHSANVDTLKPIVDAIGYSVGSELNLSRKKILICEGVSDYYYVKALEILFKQKLECGLTHANGSSNIGKITSLFLGIGTEEIFALVDSDSAGIKERNKLIKEGVYCENNVLTTHTAENEDRAIEDIFNREWYLKNILEYSDTEIGKANEVVSKEVSKKQGGAKYLLAKKLYEKAASGELKLETLLTEDGKKLWDKLTNAINGEER